MDFVALISKGGVVLWQRENQFVPEKVINEALAEWFVANSADEELMIGNYRVEGVLRHDLGVVCVGIYAKSLSMTAMRPLLIEVMDAFLDKAEDYVRSRAFLHQKGQVPFDPIFDGIVAARRPAKEGPAAPSSDSVEFAPTLARKTLKKNKKKKQGDKAKAKKTVDKSVEEREHRLKQVEGLKTDLNNWDDFFDKAETKPSNGEGGWTSLFSKLTNRTLKEEDVSAAMVPFKEMLTEKNVSLDIAEELCENVNKTLVGQSISSFNRIQTVIRASLRETLTKILTAKRDIDLLNEIRLVNDRKEPYVIVFCGVNGVGKSTNLSKIAFWLQQNGLSLLIAACDTFRSGAVEQLRIHSESLGIPLYTRGYDKDPAEVAQHAIYEAKRKQIQVVLVDTAGRMQDNVPLMQALVKLVHLNRPNLVLFVGEALVGNEGVDQLVKFNRALEEGAIDGIPRLIDGIVLTKFDTIDDKVGAAISMVYTTGHPILFVGTGQNYPDLKRLNVDTVIRALLGE